MTLANLRGILHRGVGAYLDYLATTPTRCTPIRLSTTSTSRSAGTACAWLQCILQAVVENYEEYKDYNTTTAQSDYGENLHLLLDFLRLKASYERHAWQCRSLWVVHAVLARQGKKAAAQLWQDAFTQLVREHAERHLQELARLESAHGARLRTIRDRLEERFARPLAVERLCARSAPSCRRPPKAKTTQRSRSFKKSCSSTPTPR